MSIDETWMAAVAARELRDDEVCFVGIGAPSLAALLAKHRHAPGMSLVYESGAIDAIPTIVPLSTGSPSVGTPTAFLGDCIDVFGALQAGRIQVGILSAAQVDRNGNLNSTFIGGTWERPKVRLVGSGGAHDIASLVGRLVIVMPHDPRRFVEHVDFVTAPGFLPDGSRPPGTQGTGPVVLITDRGRFEFVAGELTLVGVREGLSADDALEGFPWTVPQAAELATIQADAEDLVFLQTLIERSELR